VRWIGRGCAFVDISYASGGLLPTLITPGYPNVGHYFWTVPAVAFRSDYHVEVKCLDANKISTGTVGDSAPFTIATSDLVLLNPGRGSRAVDGGTVRVAWKKSGAVTNVNIFIRSGEGAETWVAANQTGTFADILLPATVWGSSQVTIRIQDSRNGTLQDSVDGHFMVRGGTPAFATALAGQTLQMGSIQTLEWAGMSSSYTVDLDLYENNLWARPLVHNLPDFGNYTWFVPEMWSTTSVIVATFKDANGVTLAFLYSGTFGVSYTTIPGIPVNRYRLYSRVTQEHLFTTDWNEYNVLGQSSAWIQEGPASKMHNGPVNVGGTAGVPYYRVYDFVSRWHHWTTDRNEYFTLRQNTSRYMAEGVDGYIFLTQVAGTTPWYRLAFPGVPGLHQWTADQNERDTLVNQRGWVEEQRQYVFP
jgi:uncharacterized protein DUF5648